MHRRAAPGGSGARGGGQKGARLIQDRSKVATGRTAFTADADVPGLLHAVIVGAPEAGARLVSANVAAARAQPGVAAVIAAHGPEAPPLFPALAPYAGAALAVVAAEDRELAERAALALEIVTETEGDPAPPDVETSPAVAWAEVHEGDPDAAFAACDSVRESVWRWPFAPPLSLEPPATLASLDEDGRLLLRVTTAAPFAVRARVARALSLPTAALRVARPQVGAPFGALADPRCAALCSALVQRTGRPVSLVESGGGTVPAAPASAGHLVRLRAGFAGGRLAALDALLVVNLGAESDEPGAAFAPASFFLRGTGVPFRLDARAVVTRLPPLPDARLAATRALRFALEGVLGEAEGEDSPRAAVVRPARVSSRTALPPPPPSEGPEAEAALERLRDLPDPEPAERTELRVGTGFAMAGAWSQPGATATAGLTANSDGSVVVRLGAGGSPAGAAEALMEVAARELGVPAENVSVVASDTDSAAGQDSGPVEPWLVARAVSEAAARLRAVAIPAGGKKARATAEAASPLPAEAVPPAVCAVRADVEVDPETGLPVVRRLALSPVGGVGHAFESWEDGQILAALRLVFGTDTIPSVLDAPEIVRVAPGRSASTAPPLGPLPDLLPAVLAATLEALSRAVGLRLREAPVRPERLLAALDAY